MFERSSTGVKPTPVARIFYSRLQPALAHLEAAHHEVKEAPAAATGVLRVGMTTIVARGTRPGLLQQLLANHPDLDFRLTQDSARTDEHTSELQSLMRISYDVFCLKKKHKKHKQKNSH